METSHLLGPLFRLFTCSSSCLMVISGEQDRYGASVQVPIFIFLFFKYFVRNSKYQDSVLNVHEFQILRLVYCYGFFLRIHLFIFKIDQIVLLSTLIEVFLG